MASIGILDSGVGGLSVLRQVHRQLPQHTTLYFADQNHVPYGTRPVAEIDSFVDAIARFLIDEGATVVVIACHAASAASLYTLRERFPHVAFVGMEPAVKPAVERSKTRTVGVLTTQATANGALYRNVVKRFGADAQIITQVAPVLVNLVEQGHVDGDLVIASLHRYVAPLLGADADAIVLACTHFPFLTETLKLILDGRAEIVDPSEAVARQVKRVSNLVDSFDVVEHKYYTSGDPAVFGTRIHQLLGVEATPYKVDSIFNHVR